MRIVQRCGNDFYEKYVRPALMLPSVRHIQRKWSALDTGGAGICTELIAQYARIATEKLFDEWECSGCISTDSMVVRDGLGWNPHRGEITGFDTHGNAAGVIAGEFGAASKRLAVRAQSEVPLESLTNEAAKHYSVAIFTSFGSYMTEDGERRAIQLVASRHAMAVMRPEHIAADLNAAVQALEAHCFHVKCISLDGAGENEAATKKLCTRSLRDLVDRADLDLQRLNLADADLDLKIAWLHPITQEPIFFISDMGHVVKRIVNALESSSDPNSKRKMRYVVDEPEVMAYPRTVCMNLSMLSDAFTAAEREDQSSAVGGPFALRTNRKLGKGHFCKNAHSRMSVPLAVQVLSDSMRELIVVMLQRDGTANLAREYKGMLELVVRVNRLVDICNCRGYMRCRHRRTIHQLASPPPPWRACRDDDVLHKVAHGHRPLSRLCNVARAGECQAIDRDTHRATAPHPRHHRHCSVLSPEDPLALGFQPASCAVRPVRARVQHESLRLHWWQPDNAGGVPKHCCPRRHSVGGKDAGA